MGLTLQFWKFLREKFFGGALMKFAERFSMRRQFCDFYGFPPRVGIHEAVRRSDLVSIRDKILAIWREWRLADKDYHGALSDYLSMSRDTKVSKDDLVAQNANVVRLQKDAEKLRDRIREGIVLAIKAGYLEIICSFNKGMFKILKSPDNSLLEDG